MTGADGTAGTRLTPQERQAAERRLQEAVGEGVLEFDEFEHRIGVVLTARTRAEIEPVLADLPKPADAPVPARPRPVRRWLLAFMSGHEERGRWRPADHTIAVAVMGGVEVDLRHAQLATDELQITAIAWMGGVEIIVPPGVEVEMTGFAFMGGKSNAVPDLPDDRAPLVRVRAFALMGEVEAKTKAPKEGLPAAVWPAPATVRRSVPARRSRFGRLGRWLAAGALIVALALGGGTVVNAVVGADAVAVMGSATEDLRGVQIDDEHVVEVVAVMGGVQVIVPPGVRVDMDTVALMGGADCDVCDRPVPDGAPVVRVRGLALMGGVDVRDTPELED